MRLRRGPAPTASHGHRTDPPPRPQERIHISRDRLALVVQQFFRRRRSAYDWTAPLGIALSLWLVLPITVFVDRWGLRADQWEIVVFIAAVASTCWLGVSIVRSARAPSPEDLLEEICGMSDLLEDRRGLYVLKCLDRQDCYRLLLYWDVVWNCWLLPHVDLRALEAVDLEMEPALRAYLARQLGVSPGSVELRRLHDHVLYSRKFSEFDKNEKSYVFQFMHARLQAGPLPGHFLDEEFTVGGRRYRWHTLGGLEAHVATMQRNGDVLRYLANHFASLFSQVPDGVERSALRF